MMVYPSSNTQHCSDEDRASGFESLWQGLQCAILRCQIHPNFYLIRLAAPSLLVYGLHDLPDTHYPLGVRSEAGLDCREAVASDRCQAPHVQSVDLVGMRLASLEAQKRQGCEREELLSSVLLFWLAFVTGTRQTEGMRSTQKPCVRMFTQKR